MNAQDAQADGCALVLSQIGTMRRIAAEFENYNPPDRDVREYNLKFAHKLREVAQEVEDALDAGDAIDDVKRRIARYKAAVVFEMVELLGGES